MEVLASAPGQESAAWDAAAGGVLWGGVNLGDEAAWVVLTDLAEGAALVRLRLEPGEGLRLPGPGPLVAGWTLDRQEPDLFLLVRRPVPDGPPIRAARL